MIFQLFNDNIDYKLGLYENVIPHRTIINNKSDFNILKF